ncbi:hypothetical protein MRS76_03755 [Rhizobiaceae bacterium n13]|uniref:Lipocalin-like domain-containing protein n=1 Tax=Ferirhizobium litorale TaxID=2927786 RepID=A0AAE3U2B8_9HYPH|nr:hypothetical protein [Fererhizobium litorale]MDI7861061.1 hypothetical protein [Fererhizobium litorale]MDI7921208.1 hypothetical protein [Fererhizobium litorale]
MSYRTSVGLTLLVASLLCAWNAQATDKPPGGVWRIVSAGELEGEKFKPLSGREAPLLGQAVSFHEDGVVGPPPLACRTASYGYEQMSALGFFQGYAGNEAEAKRIAATTELPDPADSLTVTCDNGVFDFHMIDKNRMVIMLDVVVYTLKKE